MRKERIYSFYHDGNELCSVRVSYEQAHPFEVMFRRLCRYAGRFGYDIQYQSEAVTPDDTN